ncbi:hypothetical protein KKA27_03905 [Patescibacteria group bacterium]|nr:hypothetical protein [Patescibacteria group bacterium]
MKTKFTFNTISPDEIFLDSENVSNFDYRQMEGRMEKPIKRVTFLFLGFVFVSIVLFLFGRVAYLQIVRGEDFKSRADDNHLRMVFFVPDRGLIYDRNGVVLAWNNLARTYKDTSGLAHVVGFMGRPSSEDMDKEGVSSEDIVGKSGVEKSYENTLRGQKGYKLVEVDSLNNVKTENTQKQPVSGGDVWLSLDSRINEKLYEIFSDIVASRGFRGAAGVVVNVENGEVVAMVSYPEYSSQILNDGKQEEKINAYIQDDNKPFLNRAISGLYAPGSIVKPFMAIAALNEGTIDPGKQIFSSGSISIPNPYFPEKESVFYDWKAHGWVDMKKALAVSCNVYFYSIGGGYGDVSGLGIGKIFDYMKLFGLGEKTGIVLNGEEEGLVPSPGDSVWRIGDTYNASIGQGNFQVTPLQMALAVATMANDGTILKPNILLSEKTEISGNGSRIDIPKEYFEIVKEGMREAVLSGTAGALSDLPVNIAAKTGTAELGTDKNFVNSWLIAFWPYENPQFAMSIVLERGSSSNLIGGVFVARQLIEWMAKNAPEYLEF